MGSRSRPAWYLLLVAALCTAICDWMIAQIPGVVADLNQLVCDAKTLRGLDQAHGRGGSAFIAQVMLYSAAMGVAIGQVCYAARQNHQWIVLKKLRSCF